MELFLLKKINLIENSERNYPEGVLMGIFGGGVPPGSLNPNPSYFRPCNFPHPFSDLALDRNYVIIT